MDAETRPSPALFGTTLFNGNKLLPAARSGFGDVSNYAEFTCLEYKRGDDGKLVIDKPDAEIVRKRFEIRTSGCSLGAISKWLYKTESFHQRESSKVGARFTKSREIDDFTAFLQLFQIIIGPRTRHFPAAFRNNPPNGSHPTSSKGNSFERFGAVSVGQ